MNDVIAPTNWSYPTNIWFGSGRIRDVADACAEVGMSRPLIVADPFLASLPVMTETIERLKDRGFAAELFSGLQGNPDSRHLSDGIAAYRAGNHDGVIAMGGGSALDVGKTVAFMIAQTRPVWDFEDLADYWRRANADGIAPIIAVPTTAGTGSEVGRATVISNAETHEKKIIFHPRMLPSLVIADPELTVGLPPEMTAATGMDALSHNLEAFFAPGYHPMADGIAIEGVRLVHDNLTIATKDGANITARAHLMSAAAMGGTSFQKGLGAIHSLSHPIGSLYGTHHGLTNAVVMPYVLEFNRSAIGEKSALLSRYLGLELSGGQDGVDALLDWVLTLRAELNIPHTLAELNVKPGDFARIAELALIDPTAGTNPIPLTAPAMERVLIAAYTGDVAGVRP